MKPEKVKPKAWTDYKIIFNDENENYSVMWGRYKKDKYKCLGVRWNGNEKERGYPGQGKNPTWYIEPDFLTLSILEKILTIAKEREQEEPTRNIKQAIKDYLNQ